MLLSRALMYQPILTPGGAPYQTSIFSILAKSSLQDQGEGSSQDSCIPSLHLLKPS